MNNHFRGEFDLDFVKEVMVKSLFPSEEDGDPEHYDINFNYLTNQVILEEV